LIVSQPGRDGQVITVFRGCDGPEWEANARLIAAAPDLLAALESIALIANGGHGTPATNLVGITKKARAAIAKAGK
jgi:hypothetical protein